WPAASSRMIPAPATPTPSRTTETAKRLCAPKAVGRMAGASPVDCMSRRAPPATTALPAAVRLVARPCGVRGQVPVLAPVLTLAAAGAGRGCGMPATGLLATGPGDFFRGAGFAASGALAISFFRLFGT